MSFLSNLFSKIFRRKNQSQPQPSQQNVQPTPAPSIPTPVPTPPPAPTGDATLGPPQPKVDPKVLLYPGTTTWGDWRDVKPGESPAEYYARTGLAGYGHTAAELSKINFDRQPEDLKKYFKETMATGPFDPKSLSDDDLYYINRHAAEMTFDPRSLMQGQFFGADVGNTGSQKYGDGSAHYDVVANESKIRPDVVKAIREMAQKEVKPWMAQAFQELKDERPDGWKYQHLASWNAGWKRLHPGMEP